MPGLLARFSHFTGMEVLAVPFNPRGNREDPREIVALVESDIGIPK